MAIRHIRKHMAYSPTPLDQHFIYAFGFWASISSGEPLILGARNEWRDSGRTAEDFANRPASTPCGLTSETAEGMVQFPGVFQEAWKHYVSKHDKMTHESRATPELIERFGVEAVPTLVIIDAAGRVQSVSAGLTDVDELGRIFRPLMQ